MTINNTTLVSDAFSKQASVFDELNEANGISRYLRKIFRDEVLLHRQNKSRILELNCGTGLDALYLASAGHEILATDNAPGMLSKLDEKISTQGIKNIKTLRCSFHDVGKLNEGKFDAIISNFGGLNCTDDLPSVLRQFNSVLNPGGTVTLMIMPKVCPWELLMVFKGKFRTAFRRFKHGTPAQVEGVHFNCFYYNPGVIKKALGPHFKTISLRGVCITVPPEFYQRFDERYPRVFKLLKRVDNRIGSYFPFTYCCDHFLITLKKK